MEPQDNMQIALRKAISAHEQAQAALGDLMKDETDPRYREMIGRIQANLDELQALADGTGPAQRV
ncbi:MAG TPA: hypothetical protein VFQ45_21160 [Longimicrobium sp.]|nr:hypothetical protein [Longimicrobium sp.]